MPRRCTILLDFYKILYYRAHRVFLIVSFDFKLLSCGRNIQNNRLSPQTHTILIFKQDVLLKIGFVKLFNSHEPLKDLKKYRL